MKAERKQTEPEFVPVIVTLESQEEVDALFTIANHIAVIRGLPVVDKWYDILMPFVSNHDHRQILWEQLNSAMQ